MPLDLEGPHVRAAIHQMATQTPPEETGIGPWPYLALAGGNAADLITTLQAMASGRGREVNPVLKGLGPAGMTAAKLGGTAGFALLMRLLATEHPTVAKWLGYGNGAAMGAMAVHNARVGR